MLMLFSYICIFRFGTGPTENISKNANTIKEYCLWGVGFNSIVMRKS